MDNIEAATFATYRKGVLAFLCLAFRNPLMTLDGRLTGGCFGNSSILGSYASKASSYH